MQAIKQAIMKAIMQVIVQAILSAIMWATIQAIMQAIMKDIMEDIIQKKKKGDPYSRLRDFFSSFTSITSEAGLELKCNKTKQKLRDRFLLSSGPDNS